MHKLQYLFLMLDSQSIAWFCGLIDLSDEKMLYNVRYALQDVVSAGGGAVGGGEPRAGRGAGLHQGQHG